MSIASLANKQLAIERRTTTQDAWGSPSQSWAMIERVAGRVQPLSGNDAMIHGRPDLRLTHRAYFDGTPDIRSGDRLNMDGTILYVVGLRNLDQLNRMLVVDLEERDA